MWTMGLDMGTSGCKACIFDEKYAIMAEAYREYDLIFPDEGLLELDPEVVWKNITEVIREANQKALKPVGALAISAIGDVIIPVGENNRPIRPSIVDFDPRGAKEIELFTNKFGVRRFFEITGMPPLFIGSLAKILWLKEFEPETFKSVERWATYEDYIVAELGFEPAVNFSEASRTMLYDLRKWDWSDEILIAAGISREKLPRLVKSGQKIGMLSVEMREKLGFSEDVILAGGGHDMVCAAVGAGLDENRPGTAVDICGTIEGVVVAMSEPNTSEEMLRNLFPCYPAYEGFVTFSVNLTAGCIVKWYRDNIAADEYAKQKAEGKNFYSNMLDCLDTEKPGSVLFVPHFAGSGNPYFNPTAKGALFGVTLDTTRADIIQGMIEGLSYEIRQHIEAFTKAGINLNTFISVGGGAKDVRQMQLKANITGVDIIQGTIAESSALGAAAFAGIAAEQISKPSDAYNLIKQESSKIIPTKNANEFDQKYEQYKSFCRLINDFETN